MNYTKITDVMIDMQLKTPLEIIVKNIKADAIEECIEIAKDFDFYTNDGTKNILLRKLEQLKEQKGD